MRGKETREGFVVREDSLGSQTDHHRYHHRPASEQTPSPFGAAGVCSVPDCKVGVAVVCNSTGLVQCLVPISGKVKSLPAEGRCHDTSGPIRVLSRHVYYVDVERVVMK